MFERGYRQRLEADLVKWVVDGVISGEAAHSIRNARFGEEAVSRLPGIFAMLGALMLAASVSAFVAANWQEIPRLARLVGILALIAACFPIALQLGRRAVSWGDDAAVTFATLCFGAGVALVGQMYHLPSDWPAGAMLVAIGGLVAAALTGKNGPLVIAFVAMTAWSCGKFDDWGWREVHWSFPVLFVPAFLLALGRESRPVAHTAILALGVWLATLLLPYSRPSTVFILVDGGLAFSVAYIATGLLALDRDCPAAIQALLPWGVWTFGIMLCCEIGLALAGSSLSLHRIDTHVYPAFGAALVSLAALASLARERAKGTLLVVAACVLGLLIPLLFSSTASGMLVSIAVLVSAVILVAGGLCSGLGMVVVVGYAVFGVSILILLWRTVGTLLSQSLFFLVAGLALLGFALGARKLAGWSKRANQHSSESAA